MKFSDQTTMQSMFFSMARRGVTISSMRRARRGGIPVVQVTAASFREARGEGRTLTEAVNQVAELLGLCQPHEDLPCS